MSAKARFLDPLLWAVNIESLGALVGRGRPEEVVEVLGAERREERVEVKARLVNDVALDAGNEDFDRGRPYREDDEDAIATWEACSLDTTKGRKVESDLEGRSAR